MPRKGIMIDYDYCTGCHTCEVACQQEHDFPAGKTGIKVHEHVMAGVNKPVLINNVPCPTDLCDLCARRVVEGEKPACVKHCQADVIRFGPIEDLAKEMIKRPKTVLFRPR